MNAAELRVALIEPEIPQNTGNIGRTCVSMDVPLHLVEPLGFVLDDKHLKRAGLDYWPHLTWQVHKSVDEFVAFPPGKRLVLTRSWGGTSIYDFSFEPGDVLVFGKESVGLDPEIFERVEEHHVTIPMVGQTRSLNLANSVSIVLFEAMRQMSVKGFPVFEAGENCVQKQREQ